MTPEDTSSALDAARGSDEWPVRPLRNPLRNVFGRPGPAGPSVHVIRARKLLVGGLLGGAAATICCLIVFTLLYGPSGLVSAALAAAMVLFFYLVGQFVMVMFADAGARTLLVVSMTSYTGRVVVLGLVLLLYARYSERWPTLQPMAIFFTTIGVVVGWLAVEIYVFNRLRISIYDTEYKAPPGSADQP